MKSDSYRTISRCKLMPLTLKDIRFKGGFWASRIENNRRVTLPIEYRLCKQTGRIDCYRLAAGQPSRTWKELWMGDIADRELLSPMRGTVAAEMGVVKIGAAFLAIEHRSGGRGTGKSGVPRPPDR